MAFPTAVNSQITDAVTQANVKVVGDAPAMALGNLFIATSQALANAAHNAAVSQQQACLTAWAATAQAVSTLYATGTEATLASWKALNSRD
ncbi:MAG: RebB family R body protein [Magnetospirillum sp.]|nr:RebB family R body protein [Magnetospirillum sp.]